MTHQATVPSAVGSDGKSAPDANDIFTITRYPSGDIRAIVVVGIDGRAVRILVSKLPGQRPVVNWLGCGDVTGDDAANFAEGLLAAYREAVALEGGAAS